ncbi:ectoine synthase [Cupriavidus consociatus]|uniref:ectoine synthase n=1 Tax=Cupriavidus consociatus TaxID=2821357 RepID=UPI001AE48372|nr:MULTISPECIES: ectoine synthase [unclassified Cupriavidus]MBP0625433.1 ectoine synthase [Cupriavidus sp. LEh25]MDK2662174.1 ectoine synthase [Cupriavidus sp. LEh21]
MFKRSLNDVENGECFVNWGNGANHRLAVEAGRMGFTVCRTVVHAGSESLLEYKNNLEFCYCIDGEGEVEDMQGNVLLLRKGDIYVLDKHGRHFLRAAQGGDLIVVCVFNPPLKDTERCSLSGKEPSSC